MALLPEKWPRPPIAWSVGVGVLATGAVLATLVELGPIGHDSADSSKCTSRVGPQGQPARRGRIRPPAPVAGFVTPSLAREQNPEMKFAFGSSRDPLVREQLLRVRNGIPRQAVRFGVATTLSDPDSGRTIPRKRLRGSVEPVGAHRRLLRLSVCLNPAKPQDLDAGTYIGGLLVNAPKIDGARPPRCRFR